MFVLSLHTGDSLGFFCMQRVAKGRKGWRLRHSQAACAAAEVAPDMI